MFNQSTTRQSRLLCAIQMNKQYHLIVIRLSFLCWSVTVQAERAGEEKPQQEPQTPVGGQEWPSEFLSDTPVLCQQSGGKPGVTFTSAKGEVFSVLEWAPGEKWGCIKSNSFLPCSFLLLLHSFPLSLNPSIYFSIFDPSHLV